MTSSRTPVQKFGVVFIAVAIAAAIIIVCTIGGFVLGIAAPWARLVRREAATWAPLIGGLWGFLVGLAVGPVFAWRSIAAKFGISVKTTWAVGIAIPVIVSVAEYAVWHSPQMTGPPMSASRIDIDAVANEGHVVILQVSQNDSSLLYKVDTDTGRATRLTQANDFEEGAEFSPDEKRVVFVSRPQQDGPAEIMLCNLDGSQCHPLLSEAHGEFAPRFSHDGKVIYFARPTSPQRYARGFEMYSVKADGSGLKQLTHRNFGSEENVVSIYPESVSADETQALMWIETGAGNALLIYSLTDESPPITIVPNIPHGPAHPLIVNASFIPGNMDIMFMAASQGTKGFDYDVYRMETATGALEKLTAINGYASDFRVSRNGKTAAFFRWTLSRLNSVPINPSLQLLNTRTRAVSAVSATGLP